MKKFIVFLFLATFFVSHQAFATEMSLQDVFDSTITNGSIDADADSTDVETWTTAEALVDSYLITMLKADDGYLGIYSVLTGAEYNLTTSTDQTSLTFGINDSGALYINGTLVDSSFGDYFGFYWVNTTSGVISYTQDEKNTDGNEMVLTYLVDDGLDVYTQLMDGTTITAEGDNDWILAFEDLSFDNADYQDAVFFVEDMNPVPEPGTMILLGTGLLGLAGLRRKKS